MGEHVGEALHHPASCLSVPKQQHVLQAARPWDSLHILFWLFLLTLIQQCPNFTVPFAWPALWIRGWLLAAHRDERHAWNKQLVLGDGKNKGLHFSENNVVERKERSYRKMEVVLGAEIWSQLLLDCLCLCLLLVSAPQESGPGL